LRQVTHPAFREYGLKTSLRKFGALVDVATKAEDVFYKRAAEVDKERKEAWAEDSENLRL